MCPPQLSRRVEVCAVGAPYGFQVKLGLVRGKFLHAVEASYVSASSLSACRAAIARSVCPSKMPLANTPVRLHLMDAPICCGPCILHCLD